MTKMTFMPIHSKNIFTGTESLMAFKLGMQYII